MPIPAFNTQGVLPPHNGNPADMSGTSPYRATTVELCAMFGITADRREILKGFLNLRALLNQLEVSEGFQWVDGRFLEADRRKNQNPDHIQVVTFYKPSPLLSHPDYAEMAKPLKNSRATRSAFSVDHSIVNLNWDLHDIINHTRHYAGFLSHQSETGIWKGMLRLELNTTQDDAEAMQRLSTREES